MFNIPSHIILNVVMLQNLMYTRFYLHTDEQTIIWKAYFNTILAFGCGSNIVFTLNSLEQSQNINPAVVEETNCVCVRVCWSEGASDEMLASAMTPTPIRHGR